MSEALTPNSLAPEIQINDTLRLRLLEPGDSEELFDIIQSAPKIQSYVTWTAGIQTPEDVIEKIKEFQQNGEHRYALLEDQDVVGYLSILPSFNGIADEYEIGYFCAPSKRGRGYVPKAVNGVMAAARETLGAKSFTLYIEDPNSSSKSVALKLGFRPTDGLRRDPILGCLERRYEKAA